MPVLEIIVLLSGFLFIGFGMATANGSEKNSKEEKTYSILTAVFALTFIVSCLTMLFIKIFN